MEQTESDTLKRADAKSYDLFAQQFDQLTDRYSYDIAGWMLQLGGVGANSRVLDVGTGTGLLPRLAGKCARRSLA